MADKNSGSLHHSYFEDHAGTQHSDNRLLANGGRVLTVTGLGTSLIEARDRAYQAVDSIQWTEGFFRRDIGWRALQADPD